MVSHTKQEPILVLSEHFGGDEMKKSAMTNIRDALRRAKENNDEAFVHQLCGMAQGYAAAMQARDKQPRDGEAKPN